MVNHIEGLSAACDLCGGKEDLQLYRDVLSCQPCRTEATVGDRPWHTTVRESIRRLEQLEVLFIKVAALKRLGKKRVEKGVEEGTTVGTHMALQQFKRCQRIIDHLMIRIGDPADLL